MFKVGDWVTIPLGHSAENNQMTEGDRVVGIFVGETENHAEVHVVEDQGGTTINVVMVPMDELDFINNRKSVPPGRLKTYAREWVPRGLRKGLVKNAPKDN